MTIQEFYLHAGGNYDEGLRRLSSEVRIKKVLGMLSRDGSMQDLGAALEKKDYEGAFRAAHTLKGITMNLGITRLAEAVSELTETLRSRAENETIPRQFAAVEQLYLKTIEDISKLTGDDTPAGGEDGGKTIQSPDC